LVAAGDGRKLRCRILARLADPLVASLKRFQQTLEFRALLGRHELLQDGDLCGSELKFRCTYLAERLEACFPATRLEVERMHFAGIDVLGIDGRGLREDLAGRQKGSGQRGQGKEGRNEREGTRRAEQDSARIGFGLGL
jgi:hypothetical protein